MESINSNVCRDRYRVDKSTKTGIQTLIYKIYLSVPQNWDCALREIMPLNVPRPL